MDKTSNSKTNTKKLRMCKRKMASGALYQTLVPLTMCLCLCVYIRSKEWEKENDKVIHSSFLRRTLCFSSSDYIYYLLASFLLRMFFHYGLLNLLSLGLYLADEQIQIEFVFHWALGNLPVAPSCLIRYVSLV